MIDLGDRKCIPISVKTLDGIDRLKAAIVERADLPREGNIIRDAREAEAIRRAKRHMLEARDTINHEVGIDLVSIDLRSALEALGELTGESVGDDIINEIFSKFCVGK